jgi:hypothetical protein
LIVEDMSKDKQRLIDDLVLLGQVLRVIAEDE